MIKNKRILLGPSSYLPQKQECTPFWPLVCLVNIQHKFNNEEILILIIAFLATLINRNFELDLPIHVPYKKIISWSMSYTVSSPVQTDWQQLKVEILHPSNEKREPTQITQ